MTRYKVLGSGGNGAVLAYDQELSHASVVIGPPLPTDPNIIYDEGCEPPAPTHPFTELSTDHWLQFQPQLEATLGTEGIALLTAIFQLDPAVRPTITEVLNHPTFRVFRAYIAELRGRAPTVRRFLTRWVAPAAVNEKLAKL